MLAAAARFQQGQQHIQPLRPVNFDLWRGGGAINWQDVWHHCGVHLCIELAKSRKWVGYSAKQLRGSNMLVGCQTLPDIEGVNLVGVQADKVRQTHYNSSFISCK